VKIVNRFKESLILKIAIFLLLTVIISYLFFKDLLSEILFTLIIAISVSYLYWYHGLEEKKKEEFEKEKEDFERNSVFYGKVRKLIINYMRDTLGDLDLINDYYKILDETFVENDFQKGDIAIITTFREYIVNREKEVEKQIKLWDEKKFNQFLSKLKQFVQELDIIRPKEKKILSSKEVRLIDTITSNLNFTVSQMDSSFPHRRTDEKTDEKGFYFTAKQYREFAQMIIELWNCFYEKMVKFEFYIIKKRRNDQ